MRPAWRIGVGALGVLALGAAGRTGTDVRRGIFEALQTREELVNPAPASQPAPRRLGYTEYQAERQRLRGERLSSDPAAPAADRAR